MIATHGISRKLLWLLLAAIVAASGFWFFHQGNAKGKTTIPPVAIQVASVTRQDVPLMIHEIGSVMAYETVFLRSRLDSQIMRVMFHAGDFVRQGDLLFVLDDRMLKADLGQMEANLRREKAQLANLRQQFERTKNLTSQGFDSKANLDDAKASLEAQQAIVKAAEASLESTKVQLGYTQIRSPLSGRTGTINHTAGNTVKSSDALPLVTIHQIQPIRIQMTLSQHYFEQIRHAMKEGPVAITAVRDLENHVFQGTLEYIDNMVNQSSGTFIARAVIPNKEESLWPGMFVKVTLKLGVAKQVLVIPEIAIQQGQEGEYVFVIEQGKAFRRPLKIAQRENGLAIITEGIKEHDQVAIDGMMSLKDGSEIMIKNPSQPDKTAT